MKCLFVVQPGFLTEHVGVQRVILYFHTMFQEGGWGVDFACPKGGQLLEISVQRDAEGGLVSRATGRRLRFGDYKEVVISNPWLCEDDLPDIPGCIGIVYDLVPNLIAAGCLRFSNISSVYPFAGAHDRGYRYYLRNARRICCISESTRSDFLEFYGSVGDPDRVVAHIPFQCDSRVIAHSGGSHLLLVNVLDSRKNLAGIAGVLERVSAATSLRVDIVGRERSSRAIIAAFFNRLRNAGIRHEWHQGISDAALHKLYRQAGVLVFPSLYEGLGLPVLEAQQEGVPVITADNSSMPEINLNASLCFRIDDLDGMARAVTEILTYRSDVLRGEALRFAMQQRLRSRPGALECLGVRSLRSSATADSKAEPSPTEPSESRRPRVRHPVVWNTDWSGEGEHLVESLKLIPRLSACLDLELRLPEIGQGTGAESKLPLVLKEHSVGQLPRAVSTAWKFVVSTGPAPAWGKFVDADACIGRTSFGLDRLPEDWVAACNRVDEVWVPSRFNLETFAASGVDSRKLHQVPRPVDSVAFDPSRHVAHPLNPKATFNFLLITDGSLTSGWDLALSAYWKEFDASDSVCLWMLCTVPARGSVSGCEILRERVRRHACETEVWGRPLPRWEVLEMPDGGPAPFLLSCDCFVSSFRADPVGTSLVQAMLMEKPVVASNWGATTELMNTRTGYPVDCELETVSPSEPQFWGLKGLRWAVISENHLRQTLRHVVINPLEARAIGKAARGAALNRFSMEAAVDSIHERLSEIESRLFAPSLAPAPTLNLHKVDFDPTTPCFKVALEGSFLDLGSLSHVNRALLSALSNHPGIEAVPVSQEAKGAATEKAGALGIARRIHEKPPVGTQVTIRHEWPPRWMPPSVGRWVLMQPWEFGSLPAEWVARTQDVSEIWCYSRFVRDVYINSGVQPSKLRLLPLGVDSSVFHPKAEPRRIPTRKTFKFLFVGGTIGRKGADLLLDVFCKAFTRQDDVCLVIKDFGGKTIYKGQTQASRIQQVQADPNAPEVLHLDIELPSAEVAGLYTACDCLVHPYRGEGFGLPVLEAMACACPVIVTGGGSTDDFATDEFVQRIPSRRVFLGSDVGGIALDGRGWWLEPDPESLARAMKAAVNLPRSWKERALAGARHVATNWTWAQTAKVAVAHISRIVAGASISSQGKQTPKDHIDRLPIHDPGGLQEAAAQLASREWAAAWDLGKAALRARPFHPEAWALLGDVAKGMEHYECSRQCYAQAMAMAPGWKHALRRLEGLPTGRDDSRPSPPPPPFKKPNELKLTVCIIARNEEVWIDNCLESVRTVADQLVLLDTGSVDRTTELARRRGAEVHPWVWTDDFAAARDAALSYATGDWVLMLDADETLATGQEEGVRSLMSEPNVLAWRLPVLAPGGRIETADHPLRLFRNAHGVRYKECVKESARASLDSLCGKFGLEIRYGSVLIQHLGADPGWMMARGVAGRDLSLLGHRVRTNPEDVTATVHLGLLLLKEGVSNPGLVLLKRSLEVVSQNGSADVEAETRERLLVGLAASLLAQQRFQDVVAILEPEVGRFASASMRYLLGAALFNQKEWGRAASEFRVCLESRHRPGAVGAITEVFCPGPCLGLGQALSHLGRFDEATAAFEQAVVDDALSEDGRIELALMLNRKGEVIPALTRLNEVISLRADHHRAWELGASIALERPETLEFALEWIGEALKHVPDNLTVLHHQAEGLFLAGQSAQARKVWSLLARPDRPRATAGKLLMQLMANEIPEALPPAVENAVGQEFLRFYRKAVMFGRGAIVQAIHAHIRVLTQLLPSAARPIEKILTEVGHG